MQTTSSRTVTGPDSKALVQVFSRYFLKSLGKLHSTRPAFYNWYNNLIMSDPRLVDMEPGGENTQYDTTPTSENTSEQLLTVWTLKIRVYPPVHHSSWKTNRTTGRSGHTQSSLEQGYWLKGRQCCAHKECYRHRHKLKRPRHRYWREQTSTKTRKGRGTAK